MAHTSLLCFIGTFIMTFLSWFVAKAITSTLKTVGNFLTLPVGRLLRAWVYASLLPLILNPFGPFAGLELCVETQRQHGNAQVNQAMIEQINQVSYCISAFFKTRVVEDAAAMLVDSTDGHMTRAYIVNSGQSVLCTAQRAIATDQQQGRRRWKRR